MGLIAAFHYAADSLVGQGSFQRDVLAPGIYLVDIGFDGEVIVKGEKSGVLKEQLSHSQPTVILNANRPVL